MRLSRIIMALTVGLAVVAVPTAAGAAQPQPAPGVGQPPPGGYVPQQPGSVSLTVRPPTIELGETAVLSGDGWNPGEVVTITVSSTPLANAMSGARRSNGETVAMAPVSFQQARPEPGLQPIVANGEGKFTVEYTPARTGRFLHVARGDSGRTDDARLLVLPKRKPKPQPLPVTGDSLGTPLKVGGGLVGAGAVLLLTTLAWRRRQRLGGAAH